MNSKEYRRHLEQKFFDLHVGDLEELDLLSDDQLESIVEELGEAQKAGRLDLETEAGITTLKEIVDRNLKVSPDDWVDYLLRIGSIESEQEYARWVLNTPINTIAQELVNQPCDTTDTEDLYSWAEKQ